MKHFMENLQSTSKQDTLKQNTLKQNTAFPSHTFSYMPASKTGTASTEAAFVKHNSAGAASTRTASAAVSSPVSSSVSSSEPVEIAAILNTYLYLNHTSAEDGDSLMEILDTLADMPEYGLSDGKYYKDYEFLCRAAAASPAGHMIIGSQASSLGFNSGTNACTFTDPRTQDIYVIYRGTSDGEWPDNGLGLCVEETPQQQEALSFFDLLAQSGRLDTDGHVYVSGHSKGGNKAQYVTLASPFSSLIYQCLSFDGQGFSPEALSHFHSCLGESELTQRRQKLWSICGDNDFVNVLGIGLVPEDHITYIHTDPETFHPAGYHDLKYLFGVQGEDGVVHFQERLNEAVPSQGDLARYASMLSRQVMELPDDTRYACAMALTQAIELGGRSPIGLHGEHFTGEELFGFAGHGLPLIFNSLLYTAEGRDVLTQFSREGLEAAYQAGGLPGLAAACWGGSTAALLAIRAGAALSTAASGLEFVLDHAVRLTYQTFDDLERRTVLDSQIHPLRLFCRDIVSPESSPVTPFTHKKPVTPARSTPGLTVDLAQLAAQASTMEHVSQRLLQEASILRRISQHCISTYRQRLHQAEAALKREQSVSAHAIQLLETISHHYTDTEQCIAQSAANLSANPPHP